MFILDKEKDCLLELIKASLFNSDMLISKDINWAKIFELAKAQCIVPLIASMVPEEHRNKWSEISYLSKAHFMKLLYEQNYIINLFENNNINYFIFKGTAAAIYYPIPSLRTYGDIDLYVFEENFCFAKRLLEQKGFHNTGSNIRHFEFVKNGIEFELHNRISMPGKYDIDHFVINNIESTVTYSLNKFSFECLPPYLNGLVLLWHIMHHLTSSGLGLRQIIDWMMFVHKELDDKTWEEKFKPLAIEAGCEKLAVTVTYMCKKWLGLPSEITWCNDANEDVAFQLLIRVLDDGNFGRDRAPVESVKGLFKKQGVFKALQQTGVNNWSLAKKYVFFRAFAWLYQLLRYLGKGIVGLFTGKKVFLKNKQNLNFEDLWKERI